ncbi:MAG: hypothetical protein IJF87_08705 [Erysipelotrichaceae bacterium]|nr:hypothetical protein [Erysipelotrichaceae bacterium]
MIKGIPVVLINKVKTGVDGFNRPTYTEQRITVNNVLVSPAESEDVISQLNLTGRKAVYTLGIPKGDTNVWEDQDVEFFGERFHVFTIQTKGIESMIPLEWNGKVMVERYEQ